MTGLRNGCRNWWEGANGLGFDLTSAPMLSSNLSVTASLRPFSHVARRFLFRINHHSPLNICSAAMLLVWWICIVLVSLITSVQSSSYKSLMSNVHFDDFDIRHSYTIRTQLQIENKLSCLIHQTHLTLAIWYKSDDAVISPSKL